MKSIIIGMALLTLFTMTGAMRFPTDMDMPDEFVGRPGVEVGRLGSQLCCPLVPTRLVIIAAAFASTPGRAAA